MNVMPANAIRSLTPELHKSIRRNPLLNMDTFVIPSPYIRETQIKIDYAHSYVWVEEGEMLGYIVVYSDDAQRSFLIYKLLTSPFVRGRGIGTALLEHFVGQISGESTIYLYIWQRQTDMLEFFLNKGFRIGDTTVYRNLVYSYIWATTKDITAASARTDEFATTEEIGKTRHDARKTMRLLSSMVDMLSIENCGRIIEDINRETTSLINTLNAFRDSVSRVHEVNVAELVLERIVPFVGASELNCELRIKLQKTTVSVLGSYDSFSRAFVNIVSNSLDAIAETDRNGVIEIKIAETDGVPYIRFRDNGIGMKREQLRLGPDGVPAFVGKTTKTRRAGEGLGTLQIFQTFGPENIVVEGVPGRGTSWKIALHKPASGADRWFVRLESRFHETRSFLTEMPAPETSREGVVAFVWQTRKVEILLFDIILHFSTYHNIRTIYRTVVSFLMDDIDENVLRERIGELRADRAQIKEWLLETALLIRARWRTTDTLLTRHDVRGAMLKSYGQAVENVIIFTLNPGTAQFFATDRKLAEHLDFAPYLGGDREKLLRGEFVGDMNNVGQPIFLGVWSIDSDRDLREKLLLIRAGVRTLIDIGIDPEKKLGFYQTTHVRHERDINSDAVTTFADFARLNEADLWRFSRVSDDDVQEMMILQD